MDKVIVALDNWNSASLNKQTYPNGVCIELFKKGTGYKTSYDSNIPEIKRCIGFVVEDRCMQGNLVELKSYLDIPENTKYLFPIRVLNRYLFAEKQQDKFSTNYYWDNALSIPEKILKDIRNNLCKIVFMFIAEGQGDWFNKEFFIKKQASFLNVPLSSIIYADANYLGPNSKDISFYYCNRWECYLQSLPKDKILDIKNSILDKNSRKKRFINFNRKARLHRMLLTEKILKSGLEKNMILTLGDTANSKKFDFNNEGIKKYNLELVKSRIPITYDIDNLVINNPTHINISAQLDAYICISSETYYIKYSKNIPHAFFSEKTFKPIVVLQPFITVNYAHSLELLKHMGYKTFHPYINESYDSEEDDYKRLDMIHDEIKRLNSLTEEEIKQMMVNLLPVLIHNAEVYNINSMNSANGYPFFNNIMNDWNKNV